MKSGNLNFLEPSEPQRPVTGLFTFLTEILGSQSDVIKIQIFWDVPMCRWVRGSRKFEGSYSLQVYDQFCTEDEGTTTVHFKRCKIYTVHISVAYKF